MCAEHLKPLEQITKVWRENAESEPEEAIVCFRKCSDILKHHFNLTLNDAQTDYKNNSTESIEKTQKEMEEIIAYIVKEVIVPPKKKDMNYLSGSFGIELTKHQTEIFRNAQKKRNIYRSRDPEPDELISAMNMKENTAEIDLEEEEDEGDESEDEGDESEDEGDESDEEMS